jgi:SAM-dependent methyltransferase
MARQTRSLDALATLVRERSPFSPEETEEIIAKRFSAVPRRLAFALERWPLATSRVLDVGSSFGTCLAHFGPGSVGVDNSEEAVRFCTSLGLDARLLDVDDEELAIIPDGGFDFLWVSDVLEHLEAPRLLLRRLVPKLAPRGRLLLHTSVLPTSRAARAAFRRAGRAPFDADVHYHQFTVQTIQHLVCRSGYRSEAAVVPVPAGYARAGRFLPPGIASRVIVEAVPDPGLEAIVRRSERRNKHVE